MIKKILSRDYYFSQNSIIDALMQGLTCEIFLSIFIFDIFFLINLFCKNEFKLFGFWLIKFLFLIFLENKYYKNKILKKVDRRRPNGPVYYLAITFIVVLSVLLIKIEYDKFNIKPIKNYDDILIFYAYLELFLFIISTLNIVIEDMTLMFFIAVCLIYGILNDKIISIILALIGLIVGSISNDDVKTILQIEFFDEEKFTKDKLKFILATLSSILVINKYTDILVNKIVGFLNSGQTHLVSDLIYKGTIRVLLSLFLYIFILKIYQLYKKKLVTRYSKSEDSKDHTDKDKANTKDQANISDEKEAKADHKSSKKNSSKVVSMAIINTLTLGIIYKILRNKNNRYKKLK